MDSSEILHSRLRNTGLFPPSFSSAPNAVSHLGAVQAQDFTAAKWALGLRVRNATDADIERAFNDGEILRTHVMRPTWHFVMPEDIRWMLELTAPRVKAFLAPYNRKLGLDEELLTKSSGAIAQALEGHTFLTRQELRAVLADNGIVPDVQGLGHIISRAELDGLICSGPLRGKQFTWALLEDRVKEGKSLSREESLEKLARRYFISHGPAQLKDFSWWSGLSGKDAEAALAAIRPDLESATRDGRMYWFFPRPDPAPGTGAAFLLSIYDEYTIAYRDRSDISDARDIERMIAMGNALTAVIIINGRVAGSWHRSVRKKTIEIRLDPFRDFTVAEKEAVESEVARYGRFFQTPAVIVGRP